MPSAFFFSISISLKFCLVMGFKEKKKENLEEKDVFPREIADRFTNPEFVCTKTIHSSRENHFPFLSRVVYNKI